MIPTRSISLLDSYLKQFNNYDEVVIHTLRNINRLRQMYPFHGDNVAGVQEAHRYFGINYPVIDPANA